MKVVVTAERAAWDAAVDPRFGRAAMFVAVDTESREIHGIDNAAGGAGVQAAAAVCRAGAEALITGHCGPKAIATLVAGGAWSRRVGRPPRRSASCGGSSSGSQRRWSTWRERFPRGHRARLLDGSQ